ncbi:hypothetical protein EMIT036CA2_10473 [Chryseobacterium sp. IT-36CA2]
MYFIEIKYNAKIRLVKGNSKPKEIIKKLIF